MAQTEHWCMCNQVHKSSGQGIVVDEKLALAPEFLPSKKVIVLPSYGPTCVCMSSCLALSLPLPRGLDNLAWPHLSAHRARPYIHQLEMHRPRTEPVQKELTELTHQIDDFFPFWIIHYISAMYRCEDVKGSVCFVLKFSLPPPFSPPLPSVVKQSTHGLFDIRYNFTPEQRNFGTISVLLLTWTYPSGDLLNSDSRWLHKSKISTSY